jgi:hypothetical protein
VRRELFLPVWSPGTTVKIVVCKLVDVHEERDCDNGEIHKSLLIQNNCNSLNDDCGDCEFLLPYPIWAADALLEIGTAILSGLLKLDGYLGQTVPASRNFVTVQCIAFLRSALLNASRLRRNEFDVKQCSRMSTG